MLWQTQWFIKPLGGHSLGQSALRVLAKHLLPCAARGFGRFNKYKKHHGLFEFALYKLQALLRLGYMYVHCVVALILLAYASTLTAQVSLAIFSPNAPSPQRSKDAKTVWVER
jgi:hypothetical protein